MRREHVFHVLGSYPAVRNEAPRDVVALGRELGVRPVPFVRSGREIPAHEPRARGVVDPVCVGSRAEDQAGVEFPAAVRVERIVGDERAEVGRAEVLFFRTERVVKVEAVGAELVRIYRHRVVGQFLCDPVVSAYRLEPPDFIPVVERDAVRFVCAVFLEQRAEAQDAFPGTLDIREHEDDEVLLAEPSRDRRPASGSRSVVHERICRDDTRVRRYRLGGRHADVRRVYPCRRPDAVCAVDAGAERGAERVAGEVDLEVRDHAFVFLRIFAGVFDRQFFDVDAAVVGPGDHGGAVGAGFFSYEYSRAGHNSVSFFHR